MFEKMFFEKIIINNLGFLNSFKSKVDKLHIVGIIQNNKSLKLIENIFQKHKFKVLEISTKTKIENPLFNILKYNLIKLKVDTLILRTFDDVYHLKYVMNCLIINESIKQLYISYSGHPNEYIQETSKIRKFYKDNKKMFYIF